MSRLPMFTLFAASGAILACGGLFGDDDEGGDDGTTGSTTEEAVVGEPVVPTPKDQSVAGLQAAVEVCTISGRAFTGDSTMSMFNSVAVDGERSIEALAGGAKSIIARVENSRLNQWLYP